MGLGEQVQFSSVSRLTGSSTTSYFAIGINNAGEVVGTYNEDDYIGAYISSGGVVTRFDPSSSP